MKGKSEVGVSRDDGDGAWSQAESSAEAALYGGRLLQAWHEDPSVARAGSQDTCHIHRPTIPARHSLFLRRSPSPSVCIGDVSAAALMKLNGPVAAPVSFARGNGAAAAASSGSCQCAIGSSLACSHNPRQPQPQGQSIGCFYVWLQLRIILVTVTLFGQLC
jgi:hypothetical protein